MDDDAPDSMYSRIGLVLGENQRNSGVQSRIDDRREAFRAYRDGKHDLLERMLEIAAIDTSVTFFTLRLMDELLCSHGVSDVTPFLLPDTAHMFQRLNKVIPALVRKQRLNGFIVGDTVESDLMFFAVTAPAFDQPLIEQIINDRGILAIEQFKSVLCEAKSLAPSLSSGGL
jgi:hypothetical protein